MSLPFESEVCQAQAPDTFNSHTSGECRGSGRDADVCARPSYYFETPDPECRVENLRDYEPGGFHPISLGDRLGEDGRFRVVHKLGQGGFATVWLCRDTLQRKWRAVKVVMAENSAEANCPDLMSIKLFKDTSKDELEAHHIVLPVHHFWIQGPNGRHLAMVLELLGPTLADMAECFAPKADFIKDVAFQLADAMEYLHSKGICHGDFTPRNACFRLADTDFLTLEDMIALLGRPETYPVREESGGRIPMNMPEYLVNPVHLRYGSGFIRREIAILDFGVSYRIGGPSPKSTGITFGYAAPEQLIETEQLGVGADVWALGACLMQIRTGATPFNEHSSAYALTEMEDFIGPLPEPFRSGYVEKDGVERKELIKTNTSLPATTTHEWVAEERALRVEKRGESDLIMFRLAGVTPVRGSRLVDEENEAWARQNNRLPSCAPSESVFESTVLRYTMPEKERKQLGDLLSKIFVYDPESRMSLCDIKRHAWFGGRCQEEGLASVRPRSTPRKRRNRGRSNRCRGKGAKGEELPTGGN